MGIKVQLYACIEFICGGILCLYPALTGCKSQQV